MIIRPKKFDAIHALVGGGISGPTDGSDMVFHDGQTPPSEAEIQTELSRLEAEWTATQYQRDRAVSFPTWQEQMDMQYHDQLDGTTTWKDAIAKVKADHPKPE